MNALQGWIIQHRLQSFTMEVVKRIHPDTIELCVVSEHDYYLTHPEVCQVIEKRVSSYQNGVYLSAIRENTAPVQ